MSPELPAVYLAARTEDQARAQHLRAALRACGVRTTARWLDQEEVPRVSAEGAAICIEDIQRADVFLLLNPAAAHRSGTGGRHVETGLALGFGKPTLILGEAENVFHSLWRVQVLPDTVPVETLATIVKLAAASNASRPVRLGVP